MAALLPLPQRHLLTLAALFTIAIISTLATTPRLPLLLLARDAILLLLFLNNDFFYYSYSSPIPTTL